MGLAIGRWRNTELRFSFASKVWEWSKMPIFHFIHIPSNFYYWHFVIWLHELELVFEHNDWTKNGWTDRNESWNKWDFKLTFLSFFLKFIMGQINSCRRCHASKLLCHNCITKRRNKRYLENVFWNYKRKKLYKTFCIKGNRCILSLNYIP